MKSCSHTVHWTVQILLVGALLAPPLAAALPAIPADIQARIRQIVDFGYAPGVVVGLQTRQGTQFYAYGQTDLTGGQPVHDETLFEIGSITKVFTTTALSAMASQGELNLSDPIQRFLPPGVVAPTYQGTAITLVHLATHASGLPSAPSNLRPIDGTNPFAGYEVAAMFDFLGAHALTRRPGSQYEYSNYGVGLLGHLLGELAHTSFATLLRERVTAVLDLNDTTLELSSLQRARLARGFSGVVPIPEFEMGSLQGAGALRSTVRDLMRFLAANNGWVESPLFSAMTNAHRLHFVTANPSVSLGLGWHRLTLPRGTAIYHDGATIGHRAFAGFLQNGNASAVVLANGDYDITDLGFRLLDPNIPLNSIRRPSEVAPETLRHYVGRYQRSASDHFTLQLSHGRLTLAYSADQGRRFTMYPSGPNRFYLHFPAAQGTLTTNQAGHALSLVWTQSGQTTTYPKVRQAARLVARRTASRLELDLLGDTDRDYVIEATSDLQAWSALSTNTIWDSPIRIPWSTSSPPAFFRVREP